MLGEALIDLVPTGPEAGAPLRPLPGGSPANVAVGLARLGVPVRLLARISGDGFGRQLRAHLAANGVDLSRVVAAAEPTSLAIVTLDLDGAAAYDFRVSGTADWQWRDEELARALDWDEPPLALHSGSLALALTPGADAIARLLQKATGRTTISYDPNCRPQLMGPPAAVRARVGRLVPLADVVKASADDLAWLYPGGAPAEVAAAWLSEGPALVAVTLGPEGALAASPTAGVVQRAAPAVPVVDTVGAGDAVTSALLAALARRALLGPGRRAHLEAIDAAALAAILDEAVVAATLTCTRPGADPPTAAELARRVSASREA